MKTTSKKTVSSLYGKSFPTTSKIMSPKHVHHLHKLMRKASAKRETLISMYGESQSFFVLG